MTVKTFGDSHKYTINSFLHLVSSRAIVFYGLSLCFLRSAFARGWG